jgi:DNA-binding CsgD family transcriptional regulator
MSKLFASPIALAALVLIQAVCAVFFVSDVVADYIESGMPLLERPHLFFEVLIAFCLVAAIAFESYFFMWLLQRKAHLDKSASIAASAINDIINAHFDGWQLTAAERDIAAFMIKGMSISEIAGLRGTAEGTIKAHLNAIYRKSETTGRSDLLSFIIDDIIGERDMANPKLVAA